MASGQKIYMPKGLNLPSWGSQHHASLKKFEILYLQSRAFLQFVPNNWHCSATYMRSLWICTVDS